MTNTLIERAARALCRSYYYNLPNACDPNVDDEWPRWTAEVIAVLRAIKEPTEAMVLAWRSAQPRDDIYIEDGWCAMIDAALQETGQ